MTAATLFSGIGSPEVAMPSWRWLWHAEIEKFPSAVMAARHPSSVNLGDVTADDFCERAPAVGRPEVLVFGSPCQSFSVAGRRLGLDDPRGNLALVALGIVARIKPAWFVFENVPGLLSSASGRDFGLFLRTVEVLGAALAWASLDAQYAGLAQRRKRLFAVGRLDGDWRRCAAVLLEPEGVCGHPPARGQARQDTTGTLAARTRGGGGLSADFDLDGGLVAGTLKSNNGGGGFGSDPSETFVPCVSPAMKSRDAKGVSSDGDGDGLPLVVTHSLRADGFDASEDGTGRGTPLVACFDPNQVTSPDNRSQPTDVAGALPARANSPIAYAIGSHAGAADADVSNRSHASGGPVGLNISEEQAYTIAFNARQDPDTWDERCGPLDTDGTTHAVTVALMGRSGGGTAELGGEVATAVRASQGGGDKAHVLTCGVRCLMPVETERLQGFPDGYTDIIYRGKPAADGPRYKAIGNSMAVPAIRWILRRIDWLHTQEIPPCPVV